jgi:prepilin-type N-terminal cleavage/methylation domain-containing protein
LKIDTWRSFLTNKGFTLIELVIVIVVLAILAGVGIPQIGSMVKASKVNATKSEMIEIKRAIDGDPQVVAGGENVARGFEGDVGNPPNRLLDLAYKPDTIPPYDRITGRGWNGPYIDTSEASYLMDAWNEAYVYSATERTIKSTGSGTEITVGF